LVRAVGQNAVKLVGRTVPADDEPDLPWAAVVVWHGYWKTLTGTPSFGCLGATCGQISTAV